MAALVNPDPEARLSADEALKHEWLSDHTPSDDHDLSSGIRENYKFDARKQWQSALNSVRAVSRLKRAGSSRSERERKLSEDERSGEDDSSGWRTPAAASRLEANRAKSDLDSDVGDSDEEDAEVGGGHGPPRTPLPDEEENENVRIHPPEEDSVDDAQKSQAPKDSGREIANSPASTQALRREEEDDAMHNRPSDYFPIGKKAKAREPDASGGEVETNVKGSTGEKREGGAPAANTTNKGKGKAKADDEDDRPELNMPGSFSEEVDEDGEDGDKGSGWWAYFSRRHKVPPVSD